MQTDRTSAIEQEVKRENKPIFAHLVRLFTFVFSSAKAVSCIYLGAFILLAFLRPFIALLWGRYIETVEAISLNDSMIEAVILLIVYFVLNFLADLIYNYIVPRGSMERLDLVQANRQQERMHTKIYQKLATLSPEYFEIAKINDSIVQTFHFIDDTQSGMNTTVMVNSYSIIGRAISVLSIASTLYIFNPWLSLIVLVAPLPILWSMTLGQKLRFRFVKENIELTRKADYYQDLMLSPAGKELKTLGLYGFFYDKWKKIADDYTIREKKVQRTGTILEMINYTIVSLANVGGSVLAIMLMAMGQLTLGSLGVVLSLVSTLVSDTRELMTGCATLFTKRNEAARFFDLMDLPGHADEGEHAEAIETIETKGISYRYPLTENYVLSDISLQIRKGEKIAFVGENGMGKTTFVKILTGMIAPSQGELIINGINAAQINATDWYDKLGTVVQESARYYTFTVADNVFIGDTLRPRDEARIDAALVSVGLGHIDRDVTLGKDIGGSELSGGEWQKLAIARCAYRNRDMMILDEPTSNLDPLAENDIFKKYIEMSEDKTVVFVTHRISIASLADRIIVFLGGKIVQDGTHEELIGREGEYSRLYNEQAKWYNR